MAVEGLDAGKELAVVAGVDEDLGVVAYSDLKERKGTDAEFVLFNQRDFELAGLERQLQGSKRTQEKMERT